MGEVVDEAGALRRGALGAAALTGGAALVGALYIRSLLQDGRVAPNDGSSNIYEHLYGTFEPAFLALLFGFALAAALLFARRPSAARSALQLPAPTPGRVAALGALLVAACWIGTRLVMHGFPLSMDEYAATFQARIFAEGRVVAPLPAAWRPLFAALTPVFITLRDDGAWLSGYLPVYAALRAGFLKLGAEQLTNPVLLGISLMALGAAARRLWPGQETRAALAVLFLAASSQALSNSMTAYAMPGHLCLNLVWLYLYLRDDWLATALLPLVGVAALGLHQPFPHFLFAAPLLLARLERRRLGSLCYLGAVYLLGAALLLQWFRFSAASQLHSAAGYFAIPDGDALLRSAATVPLLLTWQTPLLALGVAAAVLGVRRLGRTEQALAGGLCATLLFYAFYDSSQGHGWGYRYAYPVLGNLVLLGARGASELLAQAGRKIALALLAGSGALTLLVQFPLRVAEIEGFIRPFAAASRALEREPADLVLLEVDSVYYGRDLVRNDPFLHGSPKRAVASLASPERVQSVRDAGVLKTVVRVNGPWLAAHGMHLLRAR